MAKLRFIVVGSGWRSLFYWRIAQALPERFALCAMLCRTEEKAEKMHREYGVPVSTSAEQCIALHPDFVVVAVNKASIAAVSTEWLARGFAVLCETPAALEEDASAQHPHQCAGRAGRSVRRHPALSGCRRGAGVPSTDPAARPAGSNRRAGRAERGRNRHRLFSGQDAGLSCRRGRGVSAGRRLAGCLPCPADGARPCRPRSVGGKHPAAVEYRRKIKKAQKRRQVLLSLFRENGTAERPQTLRCPKIINAFPLKMPRATRRAFKTLYPQKGRRITSGRSALPPRPCG